MSPEGGQILSPTVAMAIPALAKMHGELARCRFVCNYMSGSPRAAIEGAEERQSIGRPVANYFGRALHWMFTLSKLDHPTDFQAAMSGMRALLEMMVDLSLINGQPEVYPLDKLVAWENSAMLKQAEATLARRNAQEDPELVAILEAWTQQHGESTRADRERYWSVSARKREDARPIKPAKHPLRWTGNDLGSDARVADGVPGSEDVLQLYQRMHSMLCWSVHGSAAVGFGSMHDDHFPALNATALRYGAELSMHVTRLALQYFTAFDDTARAEHASATKEHEARYVAAFENCVRESPAR